MRIVMAVFLLLSLSAAADDGQTQNLFKAGEVRHTGFGGPVIKFSPINGEFGVLVGARGGWLINSMFSVGFGGYGLADPVNADHPDTARLNLGVGGLVLEGVFLPDRLVHGTVALLIGAGTVGLERRDHSGMSAERFFALEPEVNLEINIVRYFRICPGISYRWLQGNFTTVDSEWDISGPSTSLLLKFGTF